MPVGCSGCCGCAFSGALIPGTTLSAPLQMPRARCSPGTRLSPGDCRRGWEIHLLLCKAAESPGAELGALLTHLSLQ